MPLTTRCRHCGRLFPVYAQQLRERRGKLDCPQCGKRFDALRGLLDEGIPDSASRGAGRARGKKHRPTATAPAPLLTLDRPRHRARAATSLWLLGVLVLTAGLAAQAAWWERDKWLSQPRLRSIAGSVCHRLGCELPLPRVPGAIEILQPVMAEHPQDPRKLRLNLTLINRAAFPQRFPLLQLELYDESAVLAAARRFTPGQYLTGPSRGGLAPGAAANLMLDLAMPETPPAGFRLRPF